MISAIAHLARLSRAGFVFAREGVFALVDPVLVSLSPRFQALYRRIGFPF